MNQNTPLKSYPFSSNRLLILDWASLSYHQWFTLPYKKEHSDVPIETAAQELGVWRVSMLHEILKLIKLFNPIDVVFTLEGENGWRKEYVKEYYNANTTVYYDSSAYYVRFDNRLYKLYKVNDVIEVMEMDIVKDVGSLPSTSKTLGELPERVRNMIWELKLPNQDPMMPLYKGKRNKRPWNFIIDKNDWKLYKEQYATEVAKIVRAHVIGMDGAEGDDIVYVTSRYWEKKYDSIVIVSRDSDFNQLLTQQNLKIYNHVDRDMVVCNKPEDFLEIKILMGDTSDNINGMALPNRKTKLSEGGATTMFESGNYYQKAVTEGWDGQYKRNQKLINLNYIPTHIQRSICSVLDQSTATSSDTEYLYNMGFNKKTIDTVIQMKNVGYYALNEREYIESNPDIFNPANFVNHDDIDLDVPIVRQFNQLGGVFDNPLGEESIF